MNKPAFWNDQKRAQKVTIEISKLRLQLEKENKLKQISEDLHTYIVLLEEDFNDSLLKEAINELLEIIPFIDDVETQFLLNGKTDFNGAILTIHPGAGGTESQDWAEMLLRMYNRWADKSGCLQRHS